MGGRLLPRAALLVLLAALSGGTPPARRAAAEEPKPRPADPATELFGTTKVWVVHLDIPAKEFEAMPPPPAAGFGPPPKKDERKRPSERNLFGTEFPWAEADVTADGTALKKVGVRYAADVTYLVPARGAERPLAIAFDKFGAGRLGGLAGVHLHPMPLDPAKAREVVAFNVFRSAGVVFQGFVGGERADATVARESTGVQRELKAAEVATRQMQKASAMPEGLAANLTPEQLADLVAYLQSLR
ncbi:MAG: hypothetical protein C0501_22310 [Isosphaera sp.]|nr:hypothetical protein [Isosphaera sp.]